MDQGAQLVAASMLLLAFGLTLIGWLHTKSLPYLVLNMIGSAVLAVGGWAAHQWGQLLLEGVWSLISTAGVAEWISRRLYIAWVDGRWQLVCTRADPADSLDHKENPMSVDVMSPPARREWALAPMPVHLAGSVPAAVSATPAEGMQWCLQHAGGAALTALACDVDPHWILDWLAGLGEVPGIDPVHPGRGVAGLPSYELAEDYVLTAQDVALLRVAQTADALLYAADLDTEYSLPARLQVGIPSPLDLALAAAGPTAQEWFPVLARMVRAEVAEIAALWPEQVQFQLETAAVLARYHHTPRPDWPLLTDELVGHVSDVLAAGPGIPWVLHLCHDFGHAPDFVPAHLEAPVMFLNALWEELADRGLAMPLVHLPIARGSAAPSTDPDFFAALGRLRRGIDIVAGVVAEHHPAETRTALMLTEAALGGPVAGVAAGCGLGRRSVADAAANITLAADLARECSPKLARLTGRTTR